MWKRVCGWLWAIPEWLRFGNTGSPEQIAKEESAVKLWPEAGALLKTHKDRIRQLLCDKPACKACERVVEEAGIFLQSQGADGRDPAGLTFPLSPEVCTKLPLPRGAFYDSQEETIRVEEHAASDWEECSHWALDSESGQEDSFSLSSTTITASIATRTESSSGLSKGAASRHSEDFGSKQGDGDHSKEASSEACHHEGVDVTTVPSDVASTATIRASLLPAGPHGTWVTHFTPQNVLFLEDMEIAKLESHLVSKSAHHLLGLPVALSRSLRRFMPPAPSSALRRHLSDVDVVIRPQVLPFAAEDAWGNLEVHVQKMVHLKHWQLPLKVQASLPPMEPPLEPGEEPPSVQKPRHVVIGRVEQTGKTQKAIVKLPTSAPVLVSKAIAGSQGRLRAYFTKRSLERRLEVLPAIVVHSQKMVTQARRQPLPRLIRVGHRCPQLRNRVCLSLQRKADVVEMNIKCKRIHHFWGLPTLYMESLASFAPPTPSWPTAPSRRRGFVEFGHAAPPSLTRRQRKHLESHVLRKRLQHQWGLPGLVQQSLRGFLRDASLPTHVAAVADTGLDMQVFVGFSQLLFSTLKIKQEPLETHLRRKIVARRWGLPRRVLESLRVFMPVPPSLVKRPREEEKTFLKGKAEKRMRRSLLEQRQDWKRQALQRHLAKKALEVQLGTAASVVLQSQKAACQGEKWVLCKAIPPGLTQVQPRSPEPPFVGEAALGGIQLNITHKNLTCKWGLPTLYNASLARLFQHAVFPAPTAPTPARAAAFGFSGRETLFVGRKIREALESHVKRKTLQHSWGLPGLIQRSLRSFLPDAPHFGRKAEHQEVGVFNTDLSFLSTATKQALERNVQKRVLHQRWLLPRRVLESLKHLSPKHELGRRMPPVAGKEQGARQEAARPPQAQVLSAIQAAVRENLQRHLAKKHLEVHLEAFPAALCASWRGTFLLAPRPLPKMISPGDRHPLPRRSLLPFAGQRQMHQIEVAVRSNQLARLWELSVLPVGALRGMVSGPPSRSLRRSRAAPNFTGVRMSLPPGFDREGLERHVKRKRLQHEWGFPALIHRSLRVFMHGPPSLAASIQTNVGVCVLLPDGLFLPQSICNHLETHLQKMKLHRLWGLPRRVMDSLRLLQPERKAGAPGQKPSGASGQVGGETAGVSSVRVGVAAASVPCVFRVSKKGCQNLAKIRLHWAKKRMEMQLEAFPAVVVRSWQRAFLWKPRQHLPKLVLSGCKTPQVRKAFLPFVPKECMDRLELTVHLGHLSSLWGLGLRYGETLRAMLPPRPVSQPPEGQRAALCLSRGAARVRGQNREMLELHVRKKRLQHQWGLPLLVQSSLEAFMQDTAQGPGSPKTALPIHIGHQGLLFLPESTYSHLEHHVQRQNLQRKWGLPKRVKDSLKVLFSEVPQERRETLSVRSSSRAPGHGTRPRAGPGGAAQTEQDRKTGPGTPAAAPRQPQLCFVPGTGAAERLQQHLAKKSLEVHCEAFPAVFRASESRAPRSQPLPKLIRRDPQAPTRRHSTFSVGTEGMNQIEHALQGQHVASSLWGRGTRHVDAAAGTAPRLPSPLARFRETPYKFSEARTLFVRQRAREALERHIGKKRIQHMWGVPALVQRSLQGFIQETPPSLQKSPEPSRSAMDISVLYQELSFISWDTCRRLEHHIQRTKIQQQWGLPGKVQDSLKAFLPSAALGMAESDGKGAQSGPSRVHTGQVETPSAAPKNLHALESHLPRKRSQVGLESQAGRSGRELKRLPGRIPKGQKQPLRRPRSLLCLRPRTVTDLDMNVKHKYLTFLSGLPYKGLGPLVIVGHAGCSPVRPDQVRSRFQSLQTPLLLKEATERLECHVQKKRLHRFWGLPAAVQRSLLAFAPPASTSVVRPPYRVARKVRIQVEHLPFVSERVQEDLEASLKKMITRGRWALPKKVQKFLRGLTPNALVGRDPQGSTRRGSSSSGRDKKKNVVKMPEVTYVEAPSKKVSSGVPVTFCPIAELFKHSSILDTHLRKKNLEIKFQLIPAVVHHKAFAGSIKDICLPKCPFSLVKPGRAFPRFVDEESLLKIEQNISRKYLTYLWGLPSLHTESLRKLFGNVPEFLKPRHVFLVGDTLDSPRLGRDAAGGAMRRGSSTDTSTVSGESVYTPATLGPPLLTEEALELLESHARNKKLQHTWGLPTIIQKSLRQFAPTYAEPQRPSVKLDLAATRSQGAREGRVEAQRLPPFDPALMEDLEEDMIYYTATYTWHLPRCTQEMLRKTPPPLESHFQAEGSQGQAQTLLCCCDQTLQAAPDQAPREAEGLPRNQSHQATDAAERLPAEASSLLDFHIQQKRIQHAWGLPVTVQRSLRAFALPPPALSPESPKARAAALATERGKGSIVVQTPQYALHVTTSSLPFLSTETIGYLESHMHSRAAKHKWKLPKVIQDSLRVFIQAEPPEKQAEPIYPPKPKVATDVSGRSALQPPEQEPAFFPREIQNLLERHLQGKRLQHAWGLPSTVRKSLNAFAPLGPEKRAPATETPRWAREAVNVTPGSLSFLGSDTKENLESHMRRVVAERRWRFPKRVKKSLKAFLPAVSPPGAAGRPPSRPWLPRDSEPLQDTLAEPRLEAESWAWTFQGTREASAERAARKQPSPTPLISARAHSAERAAGPPCLTPAARRELELHIQHKKIQHAWGLPKAVQGSLQAFAPVPPAPPKSLDAGRPKDILARMRDGAQEPPVEAAAQGLPFLDQKTTEALEAHVRTLITEHKWRISRLLQKSAKLFLPAASRPPAGGPKEQGVVSTYCHAMAMNVAGLPLQLEAKEVPSGSEEFHRYRSELFYHIGPGGGPASWQTAEVCPLCPAAEPQHSTAATGTGGGWEAGRAASGTSSLEKITRQESSLHVHVTEVGSGQHSRISVEAWESGRPPVSPRGPSPSQCVSITSCWTETLPGPQRAASPSGRVRGRDPVPRSSKGISWQPERGIRRTASVSQSPPRAYPCRGSTSSLRSDTEQRWWRQEQEDQGKAAKTEGGESQSFSSSSSSEESVEDAAPPEQEADARVAPVTWTGSSSSTERSQDLESQSSYEDTVATHYRQGRGSRTPRRRGSLLGWCKCRRESSLCHTTWDGAAAATSAETTTTLTTTTLQGDPAQGCQPQAGTADGGEAECPWSVGGLSQFSTECEWEDVGDWDGEEEAGGESTRLGEEEGGSAEAAGGEVEPRRVDSPASELPQASVDALVRESRVILAGQATSELFGHHNAPQSATGEMGSETEAPQLPEQPPGALQSVVFIEEVHASAEIKHSEIWLCSGGEDSPAVGEAATTTTGHGAGTVPSARKEELSWRRKAPPKEPSGGPRAFVGCKEFVTGPAQRKAQPPEQDREPQFVGGGSTDERCSIVGRILERKMNLRHGLHVWRRSNEKLAVLRDGKRKGISAGHTI